jgi:hypothetical protein
MLTILWLILIVYLVAALLSWLPAPQFSGRNPVFLILVVVLLIVLLREPLHIRW